MKLTLVLSLWLALASSAFAAQSSHPPAKDAKAAMPVLSPKFKTLAEDTLDAVDRAWGESTKSDLVFEPAKLEAERLVQRLKRSAAPGDETNVSDAIGLYFGQIEICRVVGLTSDYYAQCLGKERAARNSAVTLVSGKPSTSPGSLR